MDACTGGQAVQDLKRGENRVQIAVHLSQSVAYGEVLGTRRVMVMIQKTVETVVWG